MLDLIIHEVSNELKMVSFYTGWGSNQVHRSGNDRGNHRIHLDGQLIRGIGPELTWYARPTGGQRFYIGQFFAYIADAWNN